LTITIFLEISNSLQISSSGSLTTIAEGAFGGGQVEISSYQTFFFISHGETE
jgi:hypothetical protein